MSWESWGKKNLGQGSVNEMVSVKSIITQSVKLEPETRTHQVQTSRINLFGWTRGFRMCVGEGRDREVKELNMRLKRSFGTRL